LAALTSAAASATASRPCRRRLDHAKDLCLLNVGGDLHEDRARTTGDRELVRLVERVDHRVGTDGHPGALGDWSHDADCILVTVVVHLLHAGLAHEVGGGAPGNDQKRDGVVHGAGDAADGVHQSRALGHDDRGDPPGLAEVHVGHMNGVRLVLRLNTLDFGMVDQAIENGPDRAPGVPEVVGDPGLGEPVRQCINDAHLSKAPLP
jgi:hypothetical protein